MQKFFRLLPILLILAIGVACVFPAAALGTKFGLWHFRTAFSLIGGAALTGAILLAMSGVGMLMGIARKDEKAKQRSALVAIIVLVPLGFVFFFGVKAGQVPEIHDISTDQQDPPQLQQLLSQRPDDANPLDYSPEVAAAQAKAYPAVQPLLVAGNVADTLQKAAQVAGQLGWRVVSSDTASGVLEATEESFWFGFIDDIVVRIRAEKDGSRVDVRSVSRVGRSDIGMNARRIEKFLLQMQAN